MGNGLKNLLVGDQLHHEKVHAQLVHRFHFGQEGRNYNHLLQSTLLAVAMAAAVVLAVAVAVAAATSMASTWASMASGWTSWGQEYRQKTSKWAGLTACLFFKIQPLKSEGNLHLLLNMPKNTKPQRI